MTPYIATATRDGDEWAVTVFGLPIEPGPIRVPALPQARPAASDLITAITGSPPPTTDIELYVESVAALVGDVEATRIARERAVAQERATVLRAARKMLAQGLSHEDATELLGVDVSALGLFAYTTHLP